MTDMRIKAFNWLYSLVGLGDEGHERVSILEEYVSGLEEGIETLTAELERVEGETARYREALEQIERADDLDTAIGTAYTALVRAVAAMEGGE